VAYWITSLALVVFGFLTGFSIGQPFLLVGLALIVLGPFRRRPRIFWPALLAVIAFDVGYWAVVPFSCTASAGVGASATSATSATTATTATTVCSSLIGLRYSGESVYDPSRLPALAVGLLLAGVVGSAVFALLTWQGRARPSGPAS
jgi:hypothetical protein